ncbi:O-antigen ligase family protein [Sporosarcina sp. ACRSL]|uniref:O-antigen ligase family protein n=1 Tax=Sporosarcina sp. ACRSL TaxID=2918215 RepID=UPI001EF6724A|nr:O-antigen ligase family protein [Sporosarcina sp. ACRSL]MCG7343988.1 O-antigen ligase family protein [Sporosarcina sp. ACRSL]
MKLHNLIKLTQMVVIVLIIFAGRTDFGINLPPIPIYIGVIGIIGLLLSFIIMKKREGYGLSNPLYTSLLFFFSIILLVGNYTDTNQYGFTKSLEFTFYVFFLILIIDICIQQRKDLINLIKSFYFVALLMALTSIAMGIVNNTLFTERLTFLNSGSNTFSRMMFMGLSANIFIILSSKRGFIKYFGLWIFLGAIFLSGSRQTILGAVIFVVLFLLLTTVKTKKIKGKVILKFTALLTFLLIPIVFLWPLIQESRFYSRLLLLFSEDKGASFNVRTWLIEQAFLYGKESYLFGNGTGSFALKLPEYIYPHNIFAEIFMENGILGLLILFIIIIYPLYNMKKINIRSDYNTKLVNDTLLIMYLFSLYTAQISGDLYDNRWIFIFGLLLLKNAVWTRREYVESKNSDVRFKQSIPQYKGGNN